MTRCDLSRLLTSRSARLTLLVLLMQILPLPVHAKRVALVIGNDAYEHVERLRNAASDAQAITTVLRATGFTVTLKENLGLGGMKEALRNLKASIVPGDDVVVYYSGHGVQFGGVNYLIPVDLLPQSQDEVADDSVSLQRVLDDLEDQKPAFALAIIDACRDNPFKDTNKRAIGSRGLARVSAATGQMVLYSAGVGQQALDSLGPGDKNPNGVFTRVLIQELKTPGLPAEQVLKHVRDKVVKLASSVNHEQVPALYDQSLGEFYFVPGPAVQSASVPDDEYWNRIKDSSDPRDFAEYRTAFPLGRHSPEAALLERKLTATSVPPGRSLAVTVTGVSYEGVSVAHSSETMFEQIETVPGLKPKFAGRGGSPVSDFGIGGNVLAIRVSIQPNQCAQHSTQIALNCASMAEMSAPYVAIVPVQIAFRVVGGVGNHVSSYALSKTYQFAAQTQQQAHDLALEKAVKEGSLAALQAAGVIERITGPAAQQGAEYQVKVIPAPRTAGANSMLDTPGGSVVGMEFEGEWEGTYVCRAGDSGLRLRLARADGATRNGIPVTGEVEIFPLPDSPMAPQGAYEAVGRYVGGQLTITGTHWIEQTTDLGMLGFQGRVNGLVLAGNVEAAGCGQFVLKRRRD